MLDMNPALDKNSLKDEACTPPAPRERQDRERERDNLTTLEPGSDSVCATENCKTLTRFVRPRRPRRG
jgi:hypothetical protein